MLSYNGRSETPALIEKGHVRSEDWEVEKVQERTLQVRMMPVKMVQERTWRVSRWRECG